MKHLLLILFMSTFAFCEEPEITKESLVSEITEMSVVADQMKVILDDQGRTLSIAKANWLREYNSLEQKYKDDVFGKTKIRAEKAKLEARFKAIMKESELYDQRMSVYKEYKSSLNAKKDILKQLFGEDKQNKWRIK